MVDLKSQWLIYHKKVFDFVPRPNHAMLENYINIKIDIIGWFPHIYNFIVIIK